jgi:hypothetical protein
LIKLGLNLAFITSIDNKNIVVISLFCLAVVSVLLVLAVLDLLKKVKPLSGTFKNILLFTFVLVFLLGVVSYTSTKPFLCASCHSMRPAINDLEYTKHSKIGCMDCHKKANILGLQVQNVAQVRMIFSASKNPDVKPVSPPISNDTCLECHAEIKKGIIRYKRIKVSHKEMIEKDILCTECHDDIAHRNNGVEQAAMERCANCHNEKGASARCQTCHIEKVGLGILPTDDWSIAHKGNWADLHGAKGLNTCTYCHEKKYCTRCHATEIPHPDGWSYAHGEETIRGERDCETCHKHESFCFACHRIEMPHSAVWLTVHALKVDVAGEDLCLNCHTKADCESCHKKHKQYMVEMKRSIR